MKRACIFISAVLLQLNAFAQLPSLYEKQLFVMNEDTLRCRILTPLGFSPQKKYPLVVILHGSGERGSDNELQLTWGADLFTDSLNRVRHRAVVIFPQCPQNESWSNYLRTSAKDSLGGFTFDTLAGMKKPLELLMHFIDTLVAHGGIDSRKIYLGGLSMGGFGTFEALWRRPELFAAAFPICGGGAPGKAWAYRNQLPIWIFHGDSDPVVPVSLSRQMRDALLKTSANVKYTEYPGVGHDSWKNTFQEKDLLPWLFSQQKPTVRKKKK
jgi:predicted peptidase